MAAVNNNLGSLLTNTYSSIPVFNATGEDLCESYYKFATCAVPASTTDSAGSKYRMCRVYSNDIPVAIKLSCTALTAGAFNLGLYTANSTGTGAAVSASLFAAAVSAASAIVQVDERYNALSTTTMGQRIWQLLGLSSDPGLYYDLVLTSSTAATAAGTASLQYDFTR